ncbi:hypothetical protein PIB30_023624 [Stylosanthes scabra]|uniref:Uncharacterized protein n=1 Tax=Stylosanthes scabra TaxID=79078 RepID=A0ABU6Q9R1_9FABA|nr:hypothetical protein [Stylosanthes scabra]
MFALFGRENTSTNFLHFGFSKSGDKGFVWLVFVSGQDIETVGRVPRLEVMMDRSEQIKE